MVPTTGGGNEPTPRLGIGRLPAETADTNLKAEDLGGGEEQD